MSAEDDLEQAETYATGDVLAILYRQHADIAQGLEQVMASRGDERSANLAAVTALMKQHESAEQQVIRPVIEAADNGNEAADRNAEEGEADQLILALSGMDVDSDEFEVELESLKRTVAAHAEAEESDEFPIVENVRTQEQRIELGREFLAALAR